MTEPSLPLAEMYEQMSLIRRVEERISEIYHTDKIKSPVHLSIGQEAPSVGVCQALSPSDIVFGTYRGHALYIAKGGDLNAMVAELYGKVTGCGKGKAGSMHLGDPQAGMMGTSAIVATSIPQAVGYALAEKMKGKDTIVAVFFGDGAMEEGAFHESMNFAALHELPIIFVCENNDYAIYTPLSARVKNTDFCARAEGYGMKSCKIKNNDVLEIYQQTINIIESIKKPTSGPWFMEVETQRWYEHVGPNEDWDRNYRDPGLREKWHKNDEIKRVAGMLSKQQLDEIDNRNTRHIEEAFQFAEDSPYPEASDLLEDVYSG